MSKTNPSGIGGRALGHFGLMATYMSHLRGRPAPAICITAAGHTELGIYVPPQCIEINGQAALLALREVIDEALRATEPATESNT